jgi:hypothetical protein
MPERFSASNAGKHMACHASADLAAAIPNWVPPVEDPTADNAANRGTRLHEIFAELMLLPSNDAKNFAEALLYVAEVKKRRRFKQLVEHEVQADWLATAPRTTADLVLYTKDELHILDLKTGRIPVEARDNSQLLFYAACYAHLAPQAKGVHLHIVQPWADNIDDWWATAADVQLFMMEAKQAEADIQAGDTTFEPGDHCTFCPANPRSRAAKGHPSCPVLMELYYPSVPIDEDAMLEEDQ